MASDCVCPLEGYSDQVAVLNSAKEEPTGSGTSTVLEVNKKVLGQDFVELEA